MMKLFSVFCLFFVFAVSSFGGEIKLVTENAPPYNYAENGELKGFAVALVKEMAKRVGVDDNIEVAIWGDAYKAAKDGEDYGLFSTTRSPEREKLFKWVGPLFEYRAVLYAKKGSGIKINKLEDAKKVRSIGTYKDDFWEQTLKSKGFTNLVSSEDDFINVSLLSMDEIDLWVSGDRSGIYHAKRVDLDPNFMEEVFEIDRFKNYIAFSKNVPDDVIAKWQKALDDMKKDGTYERISKEE